MKTIFAIVCYCIAIGFLVACAVVIVWKLLLAPSCTPIGNTCVIEPWSAAGVTATVLGVAATVLAVIGAVVVAGWWLQLNKIVTGRVKKLYKGHKKEISKELSDFITEQKQEVSSQLGVVERRINEATSDINKLEELTTAFIDLAEDGIITDLINTPETWEQKIPTLRMFPRVLFKMAMTYFNSAGYYLVGAEEDVLSVKDKLGLCFELLQRGDESFQTTDDLASLRNRILKIKQELIGSTHAVKAWEKALYWRDVVSQEGANPEDVVKLNAKVSSYQFRIEQLKIHHDQAAPQVEQLLQQADTQWQVLNAEEEKQSQVRDSERDTSDSQF